jgi:uncharacterized membrane protein
MQEEIHSNAAIAGHPIHPMLVPFPIGSLVGALVSDIIYWSNGDPFWARAAFWLIAAGIATGIAAAVFGAWDFWTIPRIRQFRAAWVHFLGNAVVMVLAIVNLLLRNNNIEDAVVPTGLAISALIGVILVVTGWFGGELSYRHKVGVNSQGNRFKIERIR